jgi:hypothetical protein
MHVFNVSITTVQGLKKLCQLKGLHKVGTLLKMPVRHSPFYKPNALCATQPNIARVAINNQIILSNKGAKLQQERSDLKEK